ADGTLARLLQHRAATLGAGLQTASAGSMADQGSPAAWKSGKQTTLPTFPHRLLLRRADISLSRCATLTISLVQNIGQATWFLQKEFKHIKNNLDLRFYGLTYVFVVSRFASRRDIPLPGFLEAL